MAKWHPGATRVPYSSAGSYVTAAPKICWHTVEGYGLPNYNGSAPHFTLSIKTGKLWQHIPIDQAAKSLRHPAGTVETNKANVVQVELTDAFARSSASWPRSAYDHIAKLARWIEANHGVPSKCSVTFTDANHVQRLAPSAWLKYTGHLGHQHVPSNDHYDPGPFNIGLVLAGSVEARKKLKWQRRLDALRTMARKSGWTKARRILGRKLKRLIAR